MSQAGRLTLLSVVEQGGRCALGHDHFSRILRPTITVSDSGAGAGIQAALKTFAAHDVHGSSTTAVLTAIHVQPAAFLRAQ